MTLQPKTTIAAQPSGKICKKVEKKNSHTQTTGQRPVEFFIKKFKPGYDMSTNDKFTMIFKQAYEMLNPNGEIVIGSMYIDNEATRKKQEDSYRQFGWTVITDERDCFTATKDGWWSLRFTKQRVYDYLSFIPKEKLSFIALDNYDYAMMARIKK